MWENMSPEDYQDFYWSEDYEKKKAIDNEFDKQWLIMKEKFHLIDQRKKGLKKITL